MSVAALVSFGHLRNVSRCFAGIDAYSVVVISRAQFVAVVAQRGCDADIIAVLREAPEMDARSVAATQTQP